jgi:hypothetical protein
MIDIRPYYTPWCSVPLYSLTGSIIMRMAYGYELQKDDRFVELVEHAVEGLTQTFGVGFFVDVMPICALTIPSPGLPYHSLVLCSEICSRVVPGCQFQETCSGMENFDHRRCRASMGSFQGQICAW